VLVQARRDRLDRAIEVMAAEPAFAPAVGRLCCLRGVATLTGFGLAVEIGDWHRFTGSTIGSYLGLGPSETSTGTRRAQGGITKTGNSHARRLLIEAAWHHRKRYRPSRELLRRRAHQPRRSGLGPSRATGSCTGAGPPRCPQQAPHGQCGRRGPRTRQL
jgi:transposase